MVVHAMRAMESTMNQQKSLDAFLAEKARFEAIMAELQQMSADHFGADPEAVLCVKSKVANESAVPTVVLKTPSLT